ncbi:hypothetical protein [Thalassobaculum litoreum]|uniref:Uncharacterized protein n=1 Tax=Thalassobaculum litoreum DSM 18839 TaxID=1123362 RepID=A0A8G2BI38_9PROT|nr:hypothetical protein [Thalassobaculum litoreum]SDF84150.1 hypothetical protein SAMN05660686_02498 [Thalassobaculum litoreum DSM 18839]
MHEPKDDAARIAKRLSHRMVDHLRRAADPDGLTRSNGNSTLRALLERGLIAESEDQPANTMRTTWVPTELGRRVIAAA